MYRYNNERLNFLESVNYGNSNTATINYLAELKYSRFIDNLIIMSDERIPNPPCTSNNYHHLIVKSGNLDYLVSSVINTCDSFTVCEDWDGIYWDSEGNEIETAEDLQHSLVNLNTFELTFGEYFSECELDEIFKNTKITKICCEGNVTINIDSLSRNTNIRDITGYVNVTEEESMQIESIISRNNLIYDQITMNAFSHMLLSW